jgi:uncharacterized protein
MRSLFKFFLPTYLMSWSLWSASAVLSPEAASQYPALAALSGALYLLGVFAPALVALALTDLEDGRTAAVALLRRIIQPPVAVRWYVFAVSYLVTIKLAVALLLRLATGTWPAFGQEAAYIMVIAISFSTPVQAGEEIGWRGYALPRLSTRVGLPTASIIVGIVWACWHLPFFFISGNDKSRQSFVVYLLQVIALSIAMAWVYWRTNSSLLVTMLMHAAINNTKDIVLLAGLAASNAFSFRASPVAWLTVAGLWVCAVYFLARMRGAKLSCGQRAASDMDEIAAAEQTTAA